MTRLKTTDAALPAWPMTALTAAAPFLFGLFYEYGSALMSLLLIAWLLWCRKKQGFIRLRPRLALIAVTAAVVFCGLGALWGVDRGMALVGVVKFLPLPLFLVACDQLPAERRGELIAVLPWAGAAMTALSLLLGAVPALRGAFYVNHRLAGFFQYPNTFALYLVLGAAALTERKDWKWREYVCLALLLTGAALSGSRTVTVILGAVVVLCAVFAGDRRVRIVLPAMFVLMLAASAVYARVTGDSSAAGRYLTTSVSSSTFLGRLLYARDALPVILRHPLGLGYLGYWYRQGSFQTGVYTVMHIHNDLLQFLLDVGWIPTALLVWAVVRGFCRGDAVRRIMIGAMTAHLLLDFDLQFVAMDLILLLLIDVGGEKRELRPGRTVTLAVSGVLAALCLYIGTASALYYAGQAAACAALYPGYTPAQTAVLAETQDAALADETSRAILRHNDSVTAAWDAQARLAWADGDTERMISCKRRAISLNKYALSEYLYYADMLAVGLRMYTEAGDTANAAVCRRELAAIPELLEAVREGTSSLGLRIADQPDLDLPEEYAWIYALSDVTASP